MQGAQPWDMPAPSGIDLSPYSRLYGSGQSFALVIPIEPPMQGQDQRVDYRDREGRDGAPPRPFRPGIAAACQRQHAGADEQQNAQV